MHRLGRFGALAWVMVLLTVACMGPSGPKIVIMFGVDTETLEGCEVEIDGKVVGKLEKFGENPRTAFLVKKGDHTVKIRHPTMESIPSKVSAELATQSYMLMADYEERASGDGRMSTALVLR